MKGAKVIIKKVKKRGHSGGHGGSWKVAYADFVTAMMAFFLLLWLLSMVSPEKRARVANYFKFFALFDHSGTSVLENNIQFVGESSGESPKVPDEMGRKENETKPSEGPSKGPGEADTATKKETVQSLEQQLQAAVERSKEDLMERLRREIEKKLAELKDQVIIDVFEGGVRIQLVDKDKKPMFPLASAVPTDDAKRILKVIAENVKSLDNKISIEGHTDSLSYSSGKYTNWELSTERASAARKQLETYGMSPDRLTRVAGYAATDPLIPENPADPRNRRISIMLMFPKRKAPAAVESSGGATPKSYAPYNSRSSSGTIPLRSKLDNIVEIKPSMPGQPKPAAEAEPKH